MSTQKYRIPSDYKNDVSLATHNWNTSSGGTIHPGLAIPIKWRRLEAKTTYRGKPEILLQSQPMRGPLLNGFKLTTICTFMPDSVIYGWMRSGRRFSPAEYQNFDEWFWVPTQTTPHSLTQGLNPQKTANITKTEMWRRMTTQNEFFAGDYYSVGRGGLCDWMGVAPGTVSPYVQGGSASMNWPVAPYVHYFLACYYYFANMQESDMYFTRSLPDIVSKYASSVDVPFSGVFETLNPNDALAAVMYLFADSQSGGAGNAVSNPGFKTGFNKLLSAALGNGGGLFSVPYSPDLFSNIIKMGESPTAKINVTFPEPDTPGDPYVAVPELRFQTKLQNALDRMFVSGGRWSNILRTLFGSSGKHVDVNKPEFLGVWQTSINPSNVIAQSPGQSSDGNTVDLGQMGARIDRYANFDNSREVEYYTDEPGTIMYISALVPEPSYCQGIAPDHIAGSFADRFNPEMKGLGFTGVPRWRFSTLPNDLMPGGPYNNGSTSVTIDPNMVSIGDEVSWAPLKTDFPTLHGEFAQFGFYQYWTLPRRFTEYNQQEGDLIGDLIPMEYYGTYVNPLSWQYLFDGVGFEYQNFMLLAQFRQSVTSPVPSTYCRISADNQWSARACMLHACVYHSISSCLHIHRGFLSVKIGL